MQYLNDIKSNRASKRRFNFIKKKEMTPELITFLEQLAIKLGTTSDKVWEILLIQARLSSVISLGYLIGIALITYFLYEATKKSLLRDKIKNEAERNSYREDNTISIASAMLLLFFSIFAVITIFCTCDINTIITGFVNPEFKAIEYLRSFFISLP